MASLKDRIVGVVSGKTTGSYHFSKENGVSEIPSTEGSSVEGVPDTDETHLVSYGVPDSSPEKGGMAKASYNMINSIIGAGIIGIPYAVREAGFVLGSVLLVFMAFITDYSLRILVESGLMIGVTSYQGVMQQLYGRPGFIYLTICQFFYPFFAMIGYTVIVGDTIPKVLEQIGLSGILIDERFIKVIASLLVMWPVSLFRNIAKLGKISFMAIVFVLFLCVVVLIRTSTGYTVDANVPEIVYADTHIPESMAIMVFAYMCHHNTFLIYNSLENASLRRYSNVVHISVFAAAGVAYCLAVGGYVTFRGFVQSDLLENYCVDDALVNVARVGYAFVVMFTFPIEMFVCREVLSLVIASWRGNNKQPTSYAFHFASTLGIGLIILAIGLPISKLGVVLEFSGSLFGTPLAFIFPPALYLRASTEPLKSVNKIKALLLLFFGLSLTVLGTIMAILNAVERGVTDNVDWDYCSNNTMRSTNATMWTPTTSLPVSST